MKKNKQIRKLKRIERKLLRLRYFDTLILAKSNLLKDKKSQLEGNK